MDGPLADLAITTARAQVKAREQARPADAEATERALWANLVLNTGWSIRFFQGKSLFGATAVAAALAVSSADLTRRVAREEPPAAAALVAYPAWCTFATALTAQILRLQRG